MGKEYWPVNKAGNSPHHNKKVKYDRKVLVEVLIYHWATSTSGCGCGWAELGHSHAEHIADIYELSVSDLPTL